METDEGYELILKTKNHFDVKTQTQYSPGIYELYNQNKLLKKEKMNFQTHLYQYKEMEKILKEIGFKKVFTYSNFNKDVANNDDTEMFLFECYKE